MWRGLLDHGDRHVLQTSKTVSTSVHKWQWDEAAVGLVYLYRVLPDYLFESPSLVSLHEDILVNLVTAFNINWWYLISESWSLLLWIIHLNVLPLHPCMDMTDIIMTMMTNDTIPAAVYTYIQRSSSSGSEMWLSVRQRGHLTQHQCVDVYLKRNHVGYRVLKNKTYVLGFKLKWMHGRFISYLSHSCV